MTDLATLRRKQIDYLRVLEQDTDTWRGALRDLSLDGLVSTFDYVASLIGSARGQAEKHLQQLEAPNTIDALPSGKDGTA